MDISTVRPHCSPESFRNAILEGFVAGYKYAHHANQSPNLHVMNVDPVFRETDVSNGIDESVRADAFTRMDSKEESRDVAGGLLQKFLFRWQIRWAKKSQAKSRTEEAKAYVTPDYSNCHEQPSCGAEGGRNRLGLVLPFDTGSFIRSA